MAAKPAALRTQKFGALRTKSRAVSKALQVRGGGPLDSYQAALDAKPILTKCCTSLTGFAAGDALAQLAIEKKGFDLKRFAKMCSFGFLIHGTTGHYFYNFLESIIPGPSPWWKVPLKTAIDQTLWAPVFMTMLFTYFGIFDGKPGTIWATMQRDMFTAVSGSWKTWIPAHTINFAFVPADMRILYINAIQIGFNCFLSILGSKE